MLQYIIKYTYIHNIYIYIYIYTVIYYFSTDTTGSVSEIVDPVISNYLRNSKRNCTL